jgi:hypothetical protein
MLEKIDLTKKKLFLFVLRMVAIKTKLYHFCFYVIILSIIHQLIYYGKV